MKLEFKLKNLFEPKIGQTSSNLIDSNPVILTIEISITW
jgi:hypothetical protein